MNQGQDTQDRTFFLNDMNCTRRFVVVQGTIGGLAGMVHGIFEIMLGNKPTGGLIFDPATGAFTLLPTYRISGIVTVCVGLALIIWTIGFIHRKNGPSIFLILCILLFLVGGGIAQVGFFLIAWGVSTRINQPPNWWKSGRSGNTRQRWASLWLASFTAGYVFLFTGIAIWLIATPPGTSFNEHTTAYLICWSSLIIGLVFQIMTIVSGFARDIERKALEGKYASNY
jgi:hypothetical protein